MWAQKKTDSAPLGFHYASGHAFAKAMADTVGPPLALLLNQSQYLTSLRSNPSVRDAYKWAQKDSNLPPLRYQHSALPTEL